ncbi:TrbI/VirB10 family protein [Bartonella sp. 220]|uniref:TrbI/VirB10 family protein n=1 Tax=Bartonella sp. 220B TaxID=2967260 RepID=UPI0022A9992B|nr:TrbI/VirB10 family protein [Bartonella sp. 220B]MCZ2159168.1 TrbI/VirB10 family protein [Bartonella sp. 220B]
MKKIPEQKQIEKVIDEEDEAQKRLLTRILERRLAKMEAALDSEPTVSFTMDSGIKRQSQIQNNSQKATLESLFGKSGLAPNASFSNGDGGHAPNMQSQKIASLSLGNMPGSDQSGYAGFKDKVNNHYLKIFGNALMLSVISGASQMSQKTHKTGNEDSKLETAKETLAAELGRQWGEVGIEMTRKNLNIQPTITIRPGYNFNVMVTKDIILSPWQGHPMAALPY